MELSPFIKRRNSKGGVLGWYTLCKLSKMVLLRSLSAADRKQIEKSILEKLRRDESTRNVARDLQVSQSWVAQFFKQHLSGLSDGNRNFGDKPQV